MDFIKDIPKLLSVAAYIFNRTIQTNDRPGRREEKLELKDFDNLSSDMMVQIITCLLGNFDPSLRNLVRLSVVLEKHYVLNLILIIITKTTQQTEYQAPTGCPA